MNSIPQIFARKFAEDLAFAETPRDQVIADRNLAVASYIVACEGEQPSEAFDIYQRTLAENGVQATGVIDVEKWAVAMRQLAANIYPISTDEMDILASLSNGNPYLDLSVISHPSGRHKS